MPLLTLVVMALVLCISPTSASAQDVEPASAIPPLTTGSRVRVTSDVLERRLPGIVLAVDDSVLTLQPEGGGVVKVPFATVSRLDVSLGRRRNALRGLAVGALAGLLLSFTAPVDPDFCSLDDPNFCSRGEAMLAATLVFGGIGAGIGALIRTERWTRLANARPTTP